MRKIYSIPYYKKEQYKLLRQISSDKETFPEAFEEMFADTELKYNQLKKKGLTVVRINVDVNELLKWCVSQGLVIDPESRLKYTLVKLKKMISNNEVDL